MVLFQEGNLGNGLTVITHHDPNTPLVVVNLLYKVGSRNETPEKTGFAHLFEHLMFGGSQHVPDFDKVLHRVGAENNAFTNTDITNYYIVLDAANIETALWVESDRMQFLNLDQKSLDTQKNVVVEEFKQRYLNQPYGDVMLKLRPLAYTVHPYRWPTIGMKTEHIRLASLDDVQNFHETYYGPDNAVLCICGNIIHEKAMDLAAKWFGDIPGTSRIKQEIPMEPPQTAARHLDVESDVPMDALYKAYHMPARGGKEYLRADLASDLLGRGKSSRLYQRLVKEQQLFNNIDAYLTGSSDPGLTMISGKVKPGIRVEDADRAIGEVVESLQENIGDNEFEKVINQYESTNLFAETELMHKAQSLAYFNALGDTSLINREIGMIREIQKDEILKTSAAILKAENCSTMYYRSKSR
ncbi:MAG: pitrilysin family protein [Cyclobacteriaceae bacterium]|nr:pitrilysin family protein [Cyclobacteriaceae bacterium]